MDVYSYEHNNWKYVAFLDEGNIVEVEEWCYNTYGEPGIRWVNDIKWGVVRFYYKKDITLFMLKWG